MGRRARGQETVQRCKCGGAACKSERGEAARGHAGKLTRGKGKRQNSKGAVEGDRMIGCGIYLRVSGDGHGQRDFRCRPFGNRELAPGFRRLKAERLTPERPTTVAVTRHLGMNHVRR